MRIMVILVPSPHSAPTNTTNNIIPTLVSVKYLSQEHEACVNVGSLLQPCPSGASLRGSLATRQVHQVQLTLSHLELGQVTSSPPLVYGKGLKAETWNPWDDSSSSSSSSLILSVLSRIILFKVGCQL